MAPPSLTRSLSKFKLQSFLAVYDYTGPGRLGRSQAAKQKRPVRSPNARLSESPSRTKFEKPNYFLVKQVTPTGSGSLESLLLQRGPGPSPSLRLQAGASLRSSPTGPLAESPLSQPGCSTGVHRRACLRVEPQHDTVMIIRVIPGTVSNKRV